MLPPEERMPSILDDRGADAAAETTAASATRWGFLADHGPLLLAILGLVVFAGLEISNLVRHSGWQAARCSVASATAGGHIGIRGRRSNYSGYWVDETTVDFVVEGAGPAWRTTEVLPGKDFTVGQTRTCWTKGVRVSLVSPSAMAAENRFTHFAVAAVVALVAFMWHKNREEG